MQLVWKVRSITSICMTRRIQIIILIANWIHLRAWRIVLGNRVRTYKISILKTKRKIKSYLKMIRRKKMIVLRIQKKLEIRIIWNLKIIDPIWSKKCFIRTKTSILEKVGLKVQVTQAKWVLQLCRICPNLSKGCLKRKKSNSTKLWNFITQNNKNWILRNKYMISKWRN